MADFVYEPVIDFEVHMNFIFHKLYHSVKFRIRSIIIRSSIIFFCFICYISACPYVALCYTEYACLWRQKLCVFYRTPLCFSFNAVQSTRLFMLNYGHIIHMLASLSTFQPLDSVLLFPHPISCTKKWGEWGFLIRHYCKDFLVISAIYLHKYYANCV